jgi:hypothetical protein
MTETGEPSNAKPQTLLCSADNSDVDKADSLQESFNAKAFLIFAARKAA